MSSGAVQTILVCQPAADTVAPCPAGSAPVPTQAYVLAPDQAGFLDAATAPYDFVAGGQFWLAAFVFTLTLYFGSRIYAYIISMVR